MNTVLIVEDDRLLGKTITEKLEKAGFSVFWAKNGKEAFEALENQSIGLVYLDITLPGDMDGFDILRKMKQDDMFKKIPVVILSNLGELKDVEKALDIGATDYIVKVTTSLESLIEIAEKQLTLRNIRDSTDTIPEDEMT